MRKAIWSKLYIALALLLMLTPLFGMWLLQPAEVGANQILSAPPQLRQRDGTWNLRVLNDSADYLADHFGLRQELVGLWSGLNAGLLASSAEDQVLLGKDGWLFFSPTLPDYTGQSLTDAELDAIAARLAQIQYEAESRGAVFLFTVVPNKNSLHPEAMPEAYPFRHEQSSIARLQPYLERHGVHYADLFSLPMPYYRGDTHWTQEGAAMAADRLLSALDRESAYAAGPFRLARSTEPGDLYEMLFPTGKAREEAMVYDGTLRFEHLNPPKGGNAITIRTRGEGEGSLYCWRDSFGIALYPYLADAFQEACFSRSTEYTLPEGRYDAVILELVERNLPQLLPDPAA